jgi:hypothetical protein
MFVELHLDDLVEAAIDGGKTFVHLFTETADPIVYVGAEECSRRGSNKRMGTTWAEGRMGAIVSMSSVGVGALAGTNHQWVRWSDGERFEALLGTISHAVKLSKVPRFSSVRFIVLYFS